MPVGEQQILRLLIRRDLFHGQMRILQDLMTGDACFIADHIGCGEEYSERDTRRFVDDVLAAYDAYPVAEDNFDNGSDEWIEALVNDPDYEPIVMDESMSDLDKTQRKLLSSMLYCLVRLVAESPWYDGRFKELEESCNQLLGSFDREVPAQVFWVPEIAAYELGSSPCALEDVAWRSDMVFPFPQMGWGTDGETSLDVESPGWFLNDLNCIYEMLSGKLIGESIPARNRNAITRDSELFAYLKEENCLSSIDENRVRRALELGWLDESDLVRWRNLHRDERLPDGKNRGELEECDSIDEIDRMRQQNELRERARIEDWIRSFARKEAWCREYLSMRKAYFQLGGLEGEQSKIDARRLVNAIWATLDERRIALFNEETYSEVCGHLALAIDVARDARRGSAR